MKKKNANIELLRMISMFLIIMHHAVLYSNVLSNYDTSINKYLAAVIYIGGKYGANVFFAITAYFLTEQSFKFERVVSIWKTTFFYGILFFILNFIVEIRSFELKDVLETILPIYYKSYWFVTAYIGLVLLSPFLNVLIHHLNKNAFIILLTIMACMVSIPVTFFPGARPYMDESHLFLCIFIYLVIGFYKKFMRSIPVKKDRLTCMWGGIALGGFLWMSMSAILIISINKASLNEHITYWMSGESLPMLMLTLGTSIIVFSRPPQINSFITLISKGIFDVYLIHMNHFVYLWLWNEIFHIQEYYKSPLFAIKLVGVALFVFLVCLTIGNLRRLVSDYLNKKIKIVRLEKLYKKIDLTLNLEKERG